MSETPVIGTLFQYQHRFNSDKTEVEYELCASQNNPSSGGDSCPRPTSDMSAESSAGTVTTAVYEVLALTQTAVLGPTAGFSENDTRHFSLPPPTTRPPTINNLPESWGTEPPMSHAQYLDARKQISADCKQFQVAKININSCDDIDRISPRLND
ncbi:hypothetical protein J6590_041637 [Homalodisca vitripennis]|nr:hypothetical protein J6590_041637 [Homalodisca vitripennis]